MGAANAAHGFEAAFIDRRASRAYIQERANDRFARPTDGNARLELGDAVLQEFVMQWALARLPQGTRPGRIDAGGGLQRRRAVNREEASFRESLARLPPRVERGDDLAGGVLLYRDEWIIGGQGPAVVANLLCHGGDWGHHGVRIGEQLVLQAQRVQLVHPLRQLGVHQRTNDRLDERAVKGKVGLGHAVGGRKTALIRRIVAAEGADVVQGPCFAPHHPISGREIWIGRILGFGLEYRLVEPGRQRVDQVDVAGKLAMLFLGNAAGNEDAEVTDARMDGVYDGLAVGANFVDVLVKVENPSERLLRRRDVVALRAEHDDGRPDIAEVDRGPVRCLNSSRGEIVADEQLIDDELDLLGVQVDVTSPPALEAQIARRLGVDLGIEVVLLGPERVRGILILEVLHQPSAVELAVAEVAGEGGQPAAAQEAAAVAHRVVAVNAGPVR